MQKSDQAGSAPPVVVDGKGGARTPRGLIAQMLPMLMNDDAAGIARLARSGWLKELEAEAQNEALKLAARYGGPELLAALVPELPLADRFSALRESVSFENQGSLGALLDAASARQTIPATGETLLMKAAALGSVDCVKLLLPLSDPMARDDSGRVALHHATRAANGGVEVAWLLLPVSNPNERDSFSRTPLMHAAMELNTEMLAELIPRSDALILDATGDSALTLAMRARKDSGAYGQDSASFRVIDLLAPVSDIARGEAGVGHSALDVARALGDNALLARLGEIHAQREARQLGESLQSPSRAPGPKRM